MASIVWSVGIVDGDGGKEVYVGREDGTLQRFKAKEFGLGRAENLVPNHSATPRLSLQAHSKPVTAIVINTPDEVTTCSTDGTLKTFNTAAEVEGKREVRSAPLGVPLRALVVAGEQTFAGGQDGTIFVVGSGEPQRWVGHTDVVSALSAGEANLVSASYDQTLRVWDVATGRTTFVLSGHQNQVRIVAQLGGFIFSAARDDTLRVFGLPEAGSGGEQNAPADGEAGDGSSAKPQGSVEAAPAVRPIAVIELPSTPVASFVSGANVFLGSADGKLRVIGTKDLLRTLDEFKRRNQGTFASCKKHLESNAAVAIKNRTLQQRKSVTQKKKALRAAAQDSAKAAAAARRAARTRDDEEEGEAEAQDDEEGGADAPLGDDREAELNAFVEGEKQHLAEEVAAIQQTKREKIAQLDPILRQPFLAEREKFDRLTFTRTYDSLRPDSVLALAVDGTTSSAFVASGSDVVQVQCRPGIWAL